MSNWFPAYISTTVSEQEQSARLEQARLQGETVFEFTIPVTVRVDTGFMFFRPDFVAESYAGRELGQLTRTTIARMHEDIVPGESKGHKKSSRFDLDRAKTGLARMREILQRWGVQEQGRFEVLKSVFKEVGETLEQSIRTRTPGIANALCFPGFFYFVKRNNSDP